MKSTKYWDLIKRFRLRPIRTRKELDTALEIMSELGMKSKRTREEDDYLDVLSGLITQYEATLPEVQALPVSAQNLSPQQLLRSILNENGISQAQLAREIGCQEANISAFLNGRRELSKITAVKLAKRFGASIDLFIPRLNERMAG